jgi:hypothetical protein
MELNLHPIATKCYVSGREFAEHDRVVSYLVRPSTGSGPGGEERPAVARYDLLESEDPPPQLAKVGERPMALRSEGSEPAEWAFVYCRWVTAYKPRRDDNSDRHLKLTAENLFLTLAIPAGATTETIDDSSQGINTPLLQFLALMMERKRLIKPVGYTEDGARQVYEHRASHQRYEVPVGDLNHEFFIKIQEHLGVLVGTPKPKAEAKPAEAATPATQPASGAPTAT